MESLFATSSFVFYAGQQSAQFFRSDVWLNLVLLVKGLGALSILILGFLVIYLIIKNNVVGVKIAPFKIALGKPAVARINPEIQKGLQKVKQRIAKKNTEEDRVAVLEASQLLEKALALTGHKSPSLRKNLEAVPIWVSTSLSDIMAAYNVRIKIIHSPQTNISSEEAEQAVAVIEKALKDLGLV